MEQWSTVVGLDVSKQTVVTGVLPPGRERVTEQQVLEPHPTAIEKEGRRLTAQHGAGVFV